MPKICIQAGHKNIKFNKIEALRGSTGAPEEVGKNYEIASRLSFMLRERGFEIKQTDANANADSEVTDIDWDLFLALHCDADSALTSGGFIDVPDPSADDANKESLRIAEAIESEYFKHSEIVNRPERKGKSDGVLYYYMWQVLTSKTPCVLVEMGESVDPRDRILLADTNRIASALARGVCKAFNISYDQTATSLVSVEDQIKELRELAYKNKETTERLEANWDKDREDQTAIINRVGHLEVEVKTLQDLINKIPQQTMDKVKGIVDGAMKEVQDLKEVIKDKKFIAIKEEEAKKQLKKWWQFWIKGVN